jgi:hypothetical protein
MARGMIDCDVDHAVGKGERRKLHLQLVDLFALIKFAVIFYEVPFLLCRSERPPMRKYPRQTVGADEAPSWAGV